MDLAWLDPSQPAQDRRKSSYPVSLSRCPNAAIIAVAPIRAGPPAARPNPAKGRLDRCRVAPFCAHLQHYSMITADWRLAARLARPGDVTANLANRITNDRCRIGDAAAQARDAAEKQPRALPNPLYYDSLCNRYFRPLSTCLTIMHGARPGRLRRVIASHRDRR